MKKHILEIDFQNKPGLVIMLIAKESVLKDFSALFPVGEDFNAEKFFNMIATHDISISAYVEDENNMASALEAHNINQRADYLGKFYSLEKLNEEFRLGNLVAFRSSK